MKNIFNSYIFLVNNLFPTLSTINCMDFPVLSTNVLFFYFLPHTHALYIQAKIVMYTT